MSHDPYEEGGLPAHVRLEQRVRAAVAEEKSNRWFTPPPETDDSESWALTYLDVVTLLLTLFVALMARATLDAGGVTPEARPTSLQDLSQRKMVVEEVPAPQAAPTSPLAPEAAAEEELPGSLLAGLGDGVLVRKVKGGVELRIQDRILFEPGKANLKTAAHGVLDRLVSVLAPGANPITVEGHTDDVPISSGRFPSNWELSSARASAVVRYLIDQGIPARRLRAVGYADTVPVASNESDEGRARNRRVALLLSTSR